MSAPAGLPCAVCGTPLTGPPQAPCPTCGVPAAGQAAYVVARIGLTLTELSRDRDALLQTLRAAAPGTPPQPAPQPYAPVPQYRPPAPNYPGVPQYQPPAPQPAPQPSPSRRRLSPQQVLLGLGALLLVAGAAAFVALGWTRLGLVFQAAVMLVATGAACGASAWAARRSLRATEEALAAAGAALLAVDLSAAYAKGILDVDRLPVRLWAAIACAVAVAIAVALGRLTRTTTTWPGVALLAAQPVALLLLPDELMLGPAGVAAALLIAGGDLLAVRALRPALVPVAQVLTGLAATGGAVGGLALSYGRDATDAWTTSVILVIAAGGALLLGRLPRPRPLLPRIPLPGVADDAAAVTGPGVAGLSVAGSLHTLADGPLVGAWAGVAVLTAAALLTRRSTAALVAAGLPLILVSCWFMVDSGRYGELSLVLLAATLPAALWNIRRVRQQKKIGSTLAPAILAAVMAGSTGVLSTSVAGLFLALLAAVGFGLGAFRVGRPEERALAVDGLFAALAIVTVTAPVDAWGQLGMELAIAGAAAGCYALASRRRWVGWLAVADLVVAAWIPLAGAHVTTPEAYTLPAAAGVLLVALPGLRRQAPSWATEGAAVAVALVPSAVVVVAEPTTLRLVLVVVGAVAMVTVGTLTHRQAPFVLGSAALAYVAIGLLAPYAPLLPRWITLTAAGLVLLVLGATYERRIAQAREAVTWISHMR